MMWAGWQPGLVPLFIVKIIDGIDTPLTFDKFQLRLIPAGACPSLIAIFFKRVIKSVMLTPWGHLSWQA